jgi:YhcG PDDEXK nuclease domain/DUF1016 N-terminal domain
MAKKAITKKDEIVLIEDEDFNSEYKSVLDGIIALLEQSRRLSARSVNSIMTATYWEIGRRIVEIDQRGETRKDYYGEKIVNKLAVDLTNRFGRGFGRRNLFQMRSFNLAYSKIVQTLSALSSSARDFDLIQTSYLSEIAQFFPLSWSHYVELLSCREEAERKFYEEESLRVGDDWFRVDLVLFNRRLKCLVIIDLKLGKFSHADVGQMILYTNYANEHWREEGENPPIGLILCDQKSDALAHYTLENLPNKILASEYKMVLPDEKLLEEEINKCKRLLVK